MLVAVLGPGRWGTNIIHTLNSLTDISVKVFDKSNHHLALQQAQQGTIDAIIIATPGSTHITLALPFIKLGLPTFIEKPLATSLVDANRLSTAAQKSGALVTPGHLHLFNPAYQIAKKQLKKAGPIRYLHFEGTNNGPYRNDISALWDWGPHDIYLTLDLLGTMPSLVQAFGFNSLRPQTNLYDYTTLIMSFSNNIKAMSTMSWLFPFKQKRMVAVAQRDTVIFDDIAPKKVVVYKGLGPKVPNQTLNTKLSIKPQTPQLLYPSYSSASPLTQELIAFLETVKTKKQSIATLQQGIDVVRILTAADKSLTHNSKPITI